MKNLILIPIKMYPDIEPLVLVLYCSSVYTPKMEDKIKCECSKMEGMFRQLHMYCRSISICWQLMSCLYAFLARYCPLDKILNPIIIIIPIIKKS